MSGISGINGYDAYSAFSTTSPAMKSAAETKAAETTDTKAAAQPETETYTPSAEATKALENNKKDYSAIVDQMKADMEAQKAQLLGYVREMMGGQLGGQFVTNGGEDDVWSFLASGDYTVSEAAKAKAQEAISEDGYWGVEKTSQRIVDFAKALAGDDASKADELLSAFKKGYDQATKAWGKDLPDISKQTFDAVEKKFAAWKDEAANAGSAQTTAETQAAAAANNMTEG